MLFDLMIPAFFTLCTIVPKGFQAIIESASGSQLNSVMVRSYLQERYSIPKADEPFKFEGAISEGSPGVYKNCIKWDIRSLYPSIMLTYTIEDKQKDPKGNFLRILSVLTEERLRNKKLAKDNKSEYHEALQNSQKILINSCFGFMGAPGLNFNYPKGAESITRYGREILKKAIKWATNKELEEIYGTTSNISDTQYSE
jgi:DNA polymerase I